MNAYRLKLLGVLSMLIDHLTYCFISQTDASGGENLLYYLGRGIGRSAFFIFAFILVEGYCYTRNLKKYAARLLIMALISEAPFDLMCNRFNAATFMDGQNILFLFALGLGLIHVLDILKRTYLKSSPVKYNILAGLVCAFGMLVAYFTRVDYGMAGLALILIFYFFRNGGRRLVIAVAIWSVAVIFMEYMLEWAGLIALIPIVGFYNGERGKKSGYLFYVFYPAHMLVLGLIRFFMCR